MYRFLTRNAVSGVCKSSRVIFYRCIHQQQYRLEALLADKELADQVWEAWDTAEIDDQIACIAWVLIVERPLWAVISIGRRNTLTKTRKMA